MLKQNFINIFENKAGNVTLAYGRKTEDDDQSVQIEMLSIDPDDLFVIYIELKEMHETMGEV